MEEHDYFSEDIDAPGWVKVAGTLASLSSILMSLSVSALRKTENFVSWKNVVLIFVLYSPFQRSDKS